MPVFLVIYLEFCFHWCDLYRISLKIYAKFDYNFSSGTNKTLLFGSGPGEVFYFGPNPVPVVLVLVAVPQSLSFWSQSSPAGPEPDWSLTSLVSTYFENFVRFVCTRSKIDFCGDLNLLTDGGTNMYHFLFSIAGLQ